MPCIIVTFVWKYMFLYYKISKLSKQLQYIIKTVFYPYQYHIYLKNVYPYLSNNNSLKMQPNQLKCTHIMFKMKINVEINRTYFRDFF